MKVSVELIVDLLEWIKNVGWMDGEVFGVYMVLEEVFINVIKYGN